MMTHRTLNRAGLLAFVACLMLVWTASADDHGNDIATATPITLDSTTAGAPVIGLIFGQAGLIAGASLEGTKYTRIIP